MEVFGCPGPDDTVKDRGPQDPSVGAARDDKCPALDMLAVAGTAATVTGPRLLR
jgi:hypothetical protein